MPVLQEKTYFEMPHEKAKSLAFKGYDSAGTAFPFERSVPVGDCVLQRSSDPIAHIVDFDSAAERAARIKKRKELFESIEENKWRYPADMPSAVEILREVRIERDRQISDILGLPYDESLRDDRL